MVASAAMAAVPGAGASASAPSVIRLVSITTSYRSVDVPPRKASAGDRQMFASRLVNAQGQLGKPKGAVVGSDRGTMTLESATRARLKNVATLPGGTLTASGRLEAAGNGAVSIQVVSGTGVFAGAHGTLTILAPTDPKTAVNVYRLSYGPIA